MEPGKSGHEFSKGILAYFPLPQEIRTAYSINLFSRAFSDYSSITY